MIVKTFETTDKLRGNQRNILDFTQKPYGR